ncbi:MAG: FAD-dependent oxidoreductase [Gammaproteobacteria bacterium]|nr:FAD-dependent oxidoreductase [Gammaproteobacteria bacterium]
MPIYELTLTKQQKVAEGTLVFTFEKPEGFNFKPGQYGGFTLLNPVETDALGITRRFSLLSTPEDTHITIATRIDAGLKHSAYKRCLVELQPGHKIKFAGPTGTFTLHEDVSKPAVFIAGGIGVAPFYSIIKHHQAHQSQQEIYLFYGNATPQHAAFLNELQSLVSSTFHFIPTMDQAPSSWQGESGFINNAMIKKYIKNLNAPTYYICGSPTMVTTLQEVLAEMQIDEDFIRTEDFPGY